MTCSRCATETTELRPGKWCATCERDYDTWSRRHASDIVYSALSGTAVVLLTALGIPLLGAPTVVALGSIFLGFGTIFGVHRYTTNRRRMQFLAGAAVPRAYLKP
jgi:hypothetical protein